MGGAKLLKWRLAAEGAKLLKSGAALILSIPRCSQVVSAVKRDAHFCKITNDALERCWLRPNFDPQLYTLISLKNKAH